MCYFNELQLTKKGTIRLLNHEAEFGPINIPIQNGFDFGDYPIIKPSGSNIQIVNAHWEFIAPWCHSWDDVKAGRSKYTTLNAQGEKLFDSKLYRDAALKRRCLVLSSGFYEWKHFKASGALKESAYPYHISMPGHDYFFMAGIYQPFTDRSTGETIYTFAIVTTAANKLMEQVHNKKKRMPVILPEEMANIWLFADLNETDIQLLANYKIDSSMLKAVPVAKDFRTSPDPANPFVYPELPELE